MLLVKKIFDYFVWLMFFGLLLLGGIIYATDRTYPGDKLYPFKLKFEDFALATSKILNKQVDFSIDLVMKRSNEATKILASKYGKDGLDRLDTQVELTATSISQIANPIEKKKAAIKYIAKLSEVSLVLSEKKKDFVVPPQVIVQQVQIIPTFPTTSDLPTAPPVSISQEIDNSQQTIEQTIDDMNEIANQSTTLDESPAPTSTPQPTIQENTPTPHNSGFQNNNSQNNNFQNEGVQNNTPTPTNTPDND